MSATLTTRRRFLRFRLRTLLLLPLIFALAWWWVTWPKRTMARLDEFVAAGSLDEAAKMIEFEPDYRYPPEQVASQLGQSGVKLARRSLIDFVFGRQRFEIYDKGVACWINTGKSFEHVMIDSVTVERGRVEYKWGLTMAEWIKQGK
jgi:hypothetical protein